MKASGFGFQASGFLSDAWRAYLSLLPAGSFSGDQGYEAWSFGDGPEMAERPGGLVLAGRKTATCSALWELEAEGEPVPRPGEMSIVLDGKEEPLCVIETTEVAVRRFDEVDEAIARDEGEGIVRWHTGEGRTGASSRGRRRGSTAGSRRTCRSCASGFA